MTPQLIDDLKRDEGLRLVAYRDKVGIWTVGYGHAHVAPGTVWTLAQAEHQLQADVTDKIGDLDDMLPWWRTLNDVRQDVMVELAFNMGIATLMEFHNTLAAIKAGDYVLGAKDMLISKWASEVGQRAQRLDHMMLTGARP